MSSGLGVAAYELRHLPAVMLAERRSAERIQRGALRGVNRMLAYARSRVPYYREHPGYPDEPLSSLDELAQLPLLDKRAVLDAGVERFHAPGLARWRYRVDRTGALRHGHGCPILTRAATLVGREQGIERLVL